MTGHSSKPNKLRNINTIRCQMRDITIRNGKFTISKLKLFRLSKRLVLRKPSDIDKYKSKNKASVSETLVF